MRILPVLVAATLLSGPSHAFDVMGAAAGANAGGDTAASSIRDAEGKRAAAVAKGDIGTLRKLIGGEYYHVESNGRVRTKTEFLQAMMRNDFRMSGYGLDDMEITVLGGGRAAVVTGRFHARMEGLTGRRQFRGRYVRVWTLQPDGWRNTLHQSTEIRPAGSPAPDARPLPLQ